MKARQLPTRSTPRPRPRRRSLLPALRVPPRSGDTRTTTATARRTIRPIRLQLGHRQHRILGSHGPSCCTDRQQGRDSGRRTRSRPCRTPGAGAGTCSTAPVQEKVTCSSSTATSVRDDPVCYQANVHYNLRYAHPESARRWLGCHEIGHAWGIDHNENGCMSGTVYNSGQSYGQHNIDHIEAWY